MESEYPQIDLVAFQQGLKAAGEAVAPFVKEFQDTFGKAPDERGLLDQLLLEMYQRGAKVNRVRMGLAQFQGEF